MEDFNRVDTILLVEGNPTKRELLTELLEEAGFRTVAHPDAISAANYIASPVAQFDLVITEAKICCKSQKPFFIAFKRAFPEKPMIVLSVFPSERPDDTGEYHGTCVHLHSTCEGTTLLETVRHVLYDSAKQANPLLSGGPI